MDIQGLFSPTGAPGAPASRPGAGDYQTFLTMLTVQMRNQDPLNPMAATDFAEQLATFSGVEQQMQTNLLLGALLGRSGLGDLGGWVGMEARLHGDAWFEGEAISLAPDPALGADRVFLVVRDSFGAIVDRREIPANSQSYTWAGVGSDGMTVPNGRYSFELESQSNDEVIDTAPVATYQPIREVRTEAGSVFLVLPGGLMIDSTQIAGLRQPPGR